MMDLSRLTPAPWTLVKDREVPDEYIPDVSGFPMLFGENGDDYCIAALEFAVLARNAFDVMMRRGWGPAKLSEGWGIAAVELPPTKLLAMRWPDPFTALVAADEWMKQQEET